MKTIADDEISFYNDAELKNFDLPDSIKLYLKEITSYPLLSDQERLELIKLTKEGNSKAREKLINSNLRLVVKPAYKYSKSLNHLQVLDLIQAGNEGLIKAIDNYNPSLGTALSTFAMSYIKGYILRAINQTERSVHRSAELNELITKYLKLERKYKGLNMPMPTDEEISDILDISLSRLKDIREALVQKEISLNTKTDETDKDSTETMDFIKIYENGYKEVINDMSDNELLIILKETFKPSEYFIIYYRIINDPIWSLEKISGELNITRERVRQIETKILRKLRPYLEPNSKAYKRQKERIIKTEGRRFNKIKPKPLTPNNIVLFLYLKNYLTELETDILYLLLIDKYTYSYEELARKNGISIETLIEKIKIIEDRKRELLHDKEKYKRFKTFILEEYKKDIYNIDLKSEKIDYVSEDYLNEKYGHLKIEELKELCGDDIFNTLDSKTVTLLEKFLGSNKESHIKPQYIEEQVNLIIFGYKRKNTKLGPKKLYKTFRQNLDKFTEEQILYLECYYFNKKDKSEFDEEYPNSSLNNNYLEDKLEKLYFGIYNYFWNVLSKNDYLKLRENYRDIIGEERINLLDLYYGVECSPLSFKEISNAIGLSLEKVTNKIRQAKTFCINLLNKRTSKKQLDKEKYEKYIIDTKYTLTDETRMILTLHVIEGKSYEEISSITNLSKKRIANIVIDGIRRLDMYRFEILVPDTISWKEADDFYKEYDKFLSEIDKQILELRFIENVNTNKIAEILKLDKNMLKIKIRRLNNLMKSFKIKNVNIELDDIEKEINRHPVESVLNELEKTILSLYYGIKSKFNLNGEKLTSKEISKLLNITIDKFNHTHKSAKDKLKLLKIGELKPELIYISRELLDKLLDDVNLPITYDEKEIICELLDLKGCEYLTLEELSKRLESTVGNVKRKYERSILTIYKYLTGEIEKKLNYYLDIKPILKYFSKSDRILITEYFKNELSYNEIANKYNISIDKIIGAFERIINNINGILNDPNYNKFDFEYYEKMVTNPSLPFYGNLELAMQIFDLFVGTNDFKKMSIPEIIKELKLKFDSQTVMRIIYDLMISTCKLQMGITKEKSFSIEDVEKYYTEHRNDMTPHHQKFYTRYFKKFNKSRNVIMPKEIIYDLMQNRNSNLFRISESSKEFVGGVLKTHYSEIGVKTRRAMMSTFDIKERDFMSGKEKLHAYRTLHLIDRRIKIRDEEAQVRLNNSETESTQKLLLSIESNPN